MLISLDNGVTWEPCKHPVRVIQDIPHPNDEDSQAELHFNITDEGLIMDVWVDDVCQGTSSETFTEIGDRLVDGV